MKRFVCILPCILAVLTSPSYVTGQTPAPAPIGGDTLNAPRGCSASEAIAAVSQWFTAFSRGDTAGIRRSTAKGPAFRVFSSGRFTRDEPFTRIDSVRDLLAYVMT